MAINRCVPLTKVTLRDCGSCALSTDINIGIYVVCIYEMSSYHDRVLNARCIDHCLLARLRTELVYGSSWAGGGRLLCSVAFVAN